MDPFTIATGVVGITSLAIQTAQITTEYVRDVASAPTEVRNLEAQLKALIQVLKSLEGLLRGPDMDDTLFSPGSGLHLLLQSCQAQLEKLYKKLLKKNVDTKGKVQRSVERMTWPLEKKDIVETTRRLFECSQAFQFSLQVENCKQMAKTTKDVLSSINENQIKLDQLAIVFPGQFEDLSKQLKDIASALRDSQDELHKVTIGVQDLQIKAQWQTNDEVSQWISPLEPVKRHQDVSSQRLRGTSQGLLGSSQYQDWASEYPRSRMLCCFGDPGTGKTFTTSAVVDALASSRQGGNKHEVGLTYVYCDYRDHSIQTTVNLLGALLNGLLSSIAPALPDDIIAVYENKCKRERSSLGISGIMAMIQSVCKLFERTYVCIDALDECSDTIQFLKYINELPPSTRIFTTGRKSVMSDVEVYFSGALKLIIEASEHDIEILVKSKIDQNRLHEPDIMDKHLEEEIVTHIVESSHGMFLLPALQIQVVLEARTKFKRRRALRSLPPNLDDAFGTTIERIRKQPKDTENQALRVLQWVLLAVEPLTVDDLLHALAIQVGHEKLEYDNFPSRTNFLACCLGLVIIDFETSTVRFVHYSFQEYLSGDSRFFQYIHESGHEMIAKTCLTYLSFERNGQLPATQNSFRIPLFRYAARHWGRHVRKSEQSDAEMMMLTDRYLSGDAEGRPDSAALLCTYVHRLHHHRDNISAHDFSSIHIAAYFGLCQSLSRLLLLDRSKFSIRSRDRFGRPPLCLAAQNGHATVVKLLLDTGKVDVESQPEYYQHWQTSLSLAAENGHTAVVKLLLDTGQVNIEAPNDYCLTPLTLAAENGHTAVVKLLLDTGQVNIEAEDYLKQTALSRAAARGHTAVVELLQSQGVS